MAQVWDDNRIDAALVDVFTFNLQRDGSEFGIDGLCFRHCALVMRQMRDEYERFLASVRADRDGLEKELMANLKVNWD